jgi:hypothetical protein
MKKVVRLSESELTRLIKTVVKESKRSKVNEDVENFFNPEAMKTGSAIVTMVGTTIGLLGIAGWDYIKDFYNHLRTIKGKEQEAMELESIISNYEENKIISCVYNMLGKQVLKPMNTRVSPGTQQFNIDLAQLSAGLYTVALDIDGRRAIKKFVKK